MSIPRSVPPASLLIDNENPRLIQANRGQRDAQRELAEDQGKKLVALARDILRYGLNPSDLPIITPVKNDDLKRYTVLEGNRRLTALKALENPEWLVGAVDKSVVDEMRELSREYQKEPIELVACIEVKDAEAARHWIELRHTGEREGAGIVRWNSDQAARFNDRTQGLEIQTQALNLLEEQGEITPQERSKVPAASLKRLLGTPEVRAKLGVEIVDGQLRLLGAKKDVLRALLYVVHDLLNKSTKTEHIYTRPKRVAYADNLPSAIVVKHTRQNGTGVTPKASGSSKRRQPKPKRKVQRDILIPSDCVLSVTDHRVSDIEDELRRLSLDEFPNAIGVLFRVFVELSVDCYMKARSLPSNDHMKLRDKLSATLADLTGRSKLDRKQASPVRAALQKGSFLAPSVDRMHDYIHNENVHPAPGDLRANWNSLQPFMMALWSA